MKTIQLLLADDHALVREGLKRLFALTTNIVVAAEALNGTQVLEALHRERFDIILLDMTMPGISGPDLIAHIRAIPESPPILILSMHNEPQIARRAIAAGAKGYLTKDNNPDILLAAVRKVTSGQRFIDPVIAEAISFETTSMAVERTARDILSSRELQIFLLLAKGMTVNQIAEQLSISNKTVSTHKVRLMEKMALGSMADLVRHAVDHGLAD